jgi:CysZ protein
MTLIWSKPETQWLTWLWYVVGWLLFFILAAICAVVSYLISQVLFSVFIMDAMSRITERILTGTEKQSAMSFTEQFVFLIKQEIPRAVLPVIFAVFLMIIGWLTPLGPIIALATSVVAAIFLAWDNTDLLPARQLQPFKIRFRSFLNNIPFHFGFGLLFIIPVINILFLSFAPVGGTIYQIEYKDRLRAAQQKIS